VPLPETVAVPTVVPAEQSLGAEAAGPNTLKVIVPVALAPELEPKTLLMLEAAIAVPAVPLAELSTRGGERSSDVRARVESARALQHGRYAGEGCNARAPGRWLETHGGVDVSARQLLATAGERLHLSARAFHRVLRVARTIADVEGERTVGTAHMAEALAYRPRVPDASVVASMTA